MELELDLAEVELHFKNHQQLSLQTSNIWQTDCSEESKFRPTHYSI